MVSESVGTVMSVKLRWHAGFHSISFHEGVGVEEVGEEGGGGWMGRE